MRAATAKLIASMKKLFELLATLTRTEPASLLVTVRQHSRNGTTALAPMTVRGVTTYLNTFDQLCLLTKVQRDQTRPKPEPKASCVTHGPRRKRGRWRSHGKNSKKPLLGSVAGDPQTLPPTKPHPRDFFTESIATHTAEKPTPKLAPGCEQQDKAVQ